MNISKAAEASGLTAKTIRYYEEQGLISPAPRLSNGYRDYSDQHIRELGFIGKAREQMTECCHGDDMPDSPTLDKLSAQSLK